MHKWLLKIGEKLLRKPKFKVWCLLEEIKFEIVRAVEQSQEDFASLIYQYVSAALSIHPKDYSKVYWKDVIDAFLEIHSVTVPSKNLPLVSRPSERKSQKDAWDYPGRLFYFYSNTIAAAYGWTEKEISNLSVDSGLSYIQEILTDEQLNREFIWSTTEIAYSYNKNTKESRLNKLSRPYWMMPDIHKVEKQKVPPIPKALLPVGHVVRLGEITNEAQETQPPRNN